MKKLLAITVISLSLVLLHTPSSSAIFGIGDCSKTSKSIKTIESSVKSSIRYINGLLTARPRVDSAQGVKLYDKYNKLESDLKKIRSLALKQPKCFSVSTQAVVNDVKYWDSSYYLGLLTYEDRYLILPSKNYLPLRFK